MGDQVPGNTLAPLNPYLDLNLNMNLNLETTINNYMYDVQHCHLDTLQEPVLFEPIRNVRVNCAIFKLTNFVDMGHTFYPLRP